LWPAEALASHGVLDDLLHVLRIARIQRLQHIVGQSMCVDSLAHLAKHLVVVRTVLWVRKYLPNLGRYLACQLAPPDITPALLADFGDLAGGASSGRTRVGGNWLGGRPLRRARRGESIEFLRLFLHAQFFHRRDELGTLCRVETRATKAQTGLLPGVEK